MIVNKIANKVLTKIRGTPRGKYNFDFFADSFYNNYIPHNQYTSLSENIDIINFQKCISDFSKLIDNKLTCHLL